MDEQLFLSQLNSAQQQAVTFDDGPELVVAGAGSGKTRVLTFKIVWLLEHQGLQPWNILALTFTNKAAKEMKERIAQLVGEERARYLNMGTFHSVFSHILRSKASLVGYQSGFTIYDETDSRSLVKNIVKQMGLDDKLYKAADVHKIISRAKNDLCTAEAYSNDGERIKRDSYHKMPEVYKIYLSYQDRLRQANAMDFDDLLMVTYQLLSTHDNVRAEYAARFQYVLVDEYQDTNYVQQQILWLLTRETQKLCVVGDDYQSIYAFRGAKIDNILHFCDMYPAAKEFKLERNYRSTKYIVAAANSLMKHNRYQISKDVYSEKESGEKITVLENASDRREAAVVCREIKRLKAEEHSSWSDFAILYRTNAQSRLFEEEMHRPEVGLANCYRIFGGLSFYQRKEIKDTLAYFRLAVNPDDEEAFRRVVNYPTRGIGGTTLQKVVDVAQQERVSLWKVAKDPVAFHLAVNKGTASRLMAFANMVQALSDKQKSSDALAMAQEILAQSGVKADLEQDKTVEGQSKRENIDSLISGIADFVQSQREADQGNNIALTDYLATVSLLSDMDGSDASDDKITLMTIHSAKGLEFKTVFIVGLEENIFPSQLALDSVQGIEEERRLLYVAVTRAEQHCYLSWAHSRWLYGKIDAYVRPSRFINDIDSKYLTVKSEVGETASRRSHWRKGFDEDFQINIPYTGSRPWGEENSWLNSRMQNSRPVAGQFMAEPKAKITRPHQPEEAVNPFSPSFERKIKQIGNYRNVVRAMTNGGRTSASSEPGDASAYGIKVGSVVMHGRFGRGVVRTIEGSGENCKATIDFDEVSTKQLLLRFAKLTVL